MGEERKSEGKMVPEERKTKRTPKEHMAEIAKFYRNQKLGKGQGLERFR